jgi:hypothetical protein
MQPCTRLRPEHFSFILTFTSYDLLNCIPFIDLILCSVLRDKLNSSFRSVGLPCGRLVSQRAQDVLENLCSKIGLIIILETS